MMKFGELYIFTANHSENLHSEKDLSLIPSEPIGDLCMGDFFIYLSRKDCGMKIHVFTLLTKFGKSYLWLPEGFRMRYFEDSKLEFSPVKNYHA